MITYTEWLIADLALLGMGAVFFSLSLSDEWYKRKLQRENNQLEYRIRELEKPVDEVKTRKDEEWTEKLKSAVERTKNELEAKHSKLIQDKTTAMNNLTEKYKQPELKNHDLAIRTETFDSTIVRTKKELETVMNKGINGIDDAIIEAFGNIHEQEYTDLEAELTQAHEDYDRLQGDLKQNKKDNQKRIDTLEKELQDALADKALAQRELREYKDATAKVLGPIDGKARRKISEASIANLKHSHAKEKDETKGTTIDS